jgi:hypothetical protein
MNPFARVHGLRIVTSRLSSNRRQDAVDRFVAEFGIFSKPSSRRFSQFPMVTLVDTDKRTSISRISRQQKDCLLAGESSRERLYWIGRHRSSPAWQKRTLDSEFNLPKKVSILQDNGAQILAT